MNHPKNLLGRTPAARFLKNYWQKKPLLIRGAYPEMPRLLSPNELAGLSCEGDLVSRIIIEKGGKQPWEVRQGPFNEDSFSRLPKKSWTLLVNGVDRYVPTVHRLLDSFRFIPNWRIEDIMISYAVDRGNVGAHTDQFDVFLLQAEGRREWRIEETPRETDEFREGLDIKLLKKFRPTKTWILEPGDMLYLPPRVAHHGIARGDGCMTISVGFRAPSYSELLMSALSTRFDSLHESLRYSDPKLTVQKAPGEVSRATLKEVEAILTGLLPKGEELALWFGTFVTQLREGDSGAHGGADIPPAALASYAKRGGGLLRNEGARIAYAVLAPKRIALFVNGETELLVGAEMEELARLISGGIELDSSVVQKILRAKKGARILSDLISRGVFYIPDEDE